MTRKLRTAHGIIWLIVAGVIACVIFLGLIVRPNPDHALNEDPALIPGPTLFLQEAGSARDGFANGAPDARATDAEAPNAQTPDAQTPDAQTPDAEAPNAETEAAANVRGEDTP